LGILSVILMLVIVRWVCSLVDLYRNIFVSVWSLFNYKDMMHQAPVTEVFG
jgi:hypothetical protein